jgi:hypothetical protein
LVAALSAILVCALLSTSALAANPSSGISWVGPTLESHSANTTESSPEDDLFYLIFDGLSAQSAYTMPFDGQITDVQTKGGFLTDPSGQPANPLDTMVHFQDLSNTGNGNWLVNATSGFFQMPVSTETAALANQISDFHPENLCVHAGDVVDINTEGGFEPNQPPYGNGVPLLLFDNNPNSTTGFFRGHERTGNGATVAPTTLPVTLLMRVQLAVGSDATPLCPGGTQGLPAAPTGPTLVTEASTLAGLSPPVLFKTADVAVVSGKVFIKLPAGASAGAADRSDARVSQAGEIVKGQRFVPLTQARQIPFGSELDTRHGTVAVVSAADTTPTAEQTAQFQFGVFGLFQQRSLRGLVSGNLIDIRSRQSCKIGKLARAGAAAHRQLSKTVLGRIRGTAQGKYRTSGAYSAATVRGTQWEQIDRCDGTLTRVKRGVVIVRNFRQQRNITVRAGKSYLAPAP